MHLLKEKINAVEDVINIHSGFSDRVDHVLTTFSDFQVLLYKAFRLGYGVKKDKGTLGIILKELNNYTVTLRCANGLIACSASGIRDVMETRGFNMSLCMLEKIKNVEEN